MILDFLPDPLFALYSLPCPHFTTPSPPPPPHPWKNPGLPWFGLSIWIIILSVSTCPEFNYLLPCPASPSPHLLTRKKVLCPEGTSGGILKSHHPSLHLSIRCKLCVSHNSKTNKGNLIKLHRKIKQYEKVCYAQNFCSHYQGQSHNWR